MTRSSPKDNKQLPTGVDLNRPALGIRYPWLELILRGIKTIEIRNWNTQYRGKLYLYASRQHADADYSRQRIEVHQLQLQELPHAVVVGEIELMHTRRATSQDERRAQVPAKVLAGQFAWELANPIRYDEPIPPLVKPYGSWFYPFQRKKKPS
ncbi:MAG: ASCH domain-containing protein [Planctomycetaceae bacterium]|nr:ASCH domain-containing protein [Planctomycetaceae bacterium]